MCIAIYQPVGSAILSDSTLERCWDKNKDGAGYMFVDSGKLVVRKPFFKRKELISAYQADFAAYGQTSPFVTHFRWRTHGIKDELNTHPHIICNGQVGMVHNGILPFDPPSQSKISDTVWFCITVLAERQRSQLLSQRFGAYLADMIGYNKLILMGNNGRVSIVNEKAGVWDDGIWYSNTGYKGWMPTHDHSNSGYTWYGNGCGTQGGSACGTMSLWNSHNGGGYATFDSNKQEAKKDDGENTPVPQVPVKITPHTPLPPADNSIEKWEDISPRVAKAVDGELSPDFLTDDEWKEFIQWREYATPPITDEEACKMLQEVNERMESELDARLDGDNTNPLPTHYANCQSREIV